MPFHTQKLANGLQLIGETIPSARSASVGFFVITGSRDETPEEAGVSHYLEHMMFKGTPRRSAEEVNLHFDRIGASYNAYTSEENTVFYAAILPEFLPVAIDILADILRPSLRLEDFTIEKEVILEEIERYEDNPGSMAWDHAKKIYFAGHPLGNTILGNLAGIRGLTRDQMQAYFDRRYVAPNILVAASGQFEWNQYVELVSQACSHWPSTPAARSNLTEARGVGGVHAVQKATATQQHVLTLCPGPAANSPLRYVAATLSLAIGDDSGSRLHWALVDPGKAESAYCGTDNSEGSGIAATLFTSDPESTAENLDIVRKILGEVRREGIKAEELTQAKNKIASRVVRGNERPMGRMNSIAASWMYCKEYADVDQELARFDAVSLNDIRDYLERYPIDDVTIVGYGPLNKID